MLSFAKNLSFNYLFIILLSLFSIATIASATEDTEDDCLYIGNYVVPDSGNGGTAQSLEIGDTPVPEEQLGKMKLTLVNKDWSNLSDDEQELICRKLKIKKGVFRGLVSTFIEPFPGVFIPLIDHVITNGLLNSTIHTQNDVLDPFTIVPIDACSISAVEQVNVIKGTNRYDNGTTGTLFFQAQLNFCTGQNQFELLPSHNGILSKISFSD